MDFTTFKKTKSKESVQVELNVLETSLEMDMPEGDKKIIEKRILKLKEEIALIDSTVSGDIAMATTNMSLCSEKENCECGKCELLRRKDLHEAVKINSPFGGFFSK